MAKVGAGVLIAIVAVFLLWIIAANVGAYFMGANLTNLMSAGRDCEIEVWSGGVMVGHFWSDGKVQTESGSDGYLFTNKETGRLKRCSGTVIVSGL